MATEHSTEQFTMSEHPDIVDLRTRYAQRPGTAVTTAAGGLAFLAGVYAAISPWVVGFNGQTNLAVNDFVVGVAVALLALGVASMYERMRWTALASVAMGIWLIISPWVVSGANDTRSVLWSNIVVGAVVVVLGLVSAGAGWVRIGRTGRLDATGAHLR